MEKSELKRLKKALNDKNENKIKEWSEQYENQVKFKLEKEFKEKMNNAVTNYSLAVAYTLNYGYGMGKKRLPEVMDRIWNNLESIYEGYLSIDDCSKELERLGIYINNK